MIRLAVAACVVALFAAGCGGGSRKSAVESVDKPVSAALAKAFGPASGSQSACTDVTTAAMSDCHGAMSSVSQKTLPRLLAALPLSWPDLPGYQAMFVLFHTGEGASCFDVQIARRDGSGAGPLKCLGKGACAGACLTAVTKRGRSVLGGLVAADANDLRLVYPDGTLRYRLDGPTASSLAGLRIFIADVGTRGAPREELVR